MKLDKDTVLRGPKRESKGPFEGSEGALRVQLIEQCLHLESIPADFFNERGRSEQIRRIGRGLKNPSWGSMPLDFIRSYQN